jgi:NADH:ubiquinone oxidoreductase subunit F (NADH-binding)
MTSPDLLLTNGSGVGSGPRLLAGLGEGARLDLSRHLALHGALPVRRSKRRHEHPLFAALDQAGLRGRGGGGYPSGTKMRAVKAGGRRPVVVVNASEGEPLSQKDALLLLRAPHLVLDGAMAVAEALEAKEVVIYLHRGREAIERSVHAAVDERSGDVRFTVIAGPARYVAGEASAAVSYISGGPAIPVTTPPRVSGRGVNGRPTMLSNAETYAHIGLIARHGPEWFRSVGTASEPGTLLLTVTGAVARPGVLEVPFGTTIGAAVNLAGGADPGTPAVLLGGYAGTWLRPEVAWGMSLSTVMLREQHASLGVGLIAILPTNSCVLTENARILRWLADESARQCGPCLNGLPTIAGVLEALAWGRTDDMVLGRLERLGGMVEGRGSCHHPGGAVGTYRSVLASFRDHVNEHLLTGPCEYALTSSALTIPAAPIGSDAEFK